MMQLATGSENSTHLMKKFAIITGAGVVAFALFVAFVEFSGLFADAGISTFGWFAFLIAAFLTILVSSGLFALIFFSARTGRDDISDL